jgi:protein SCO1/2
MREQRKLTGLRIWVAAALALAALVFAAPTWAMDHAMPMAAMPVPRALPGLSIYNLDAEWTTQEGGRARLSSLAGRPVLAAMVYTSCTDVCPLNTERMQDIERALPASSRGKIKLVLVSLDWVRDTPQRLKLFAAQHRLDLRRWTLLHSDEDDVRALAAALGVSFHRDANGDFQHSIAIFLLDSHGVVVSQESDFGRPPARMAAQIQRLLAKSPPR